MPRTVPGASERSCNSPHTNATWDQQLDELTFYTRHNRWASWVLCGWQEGLGNRDAALSWALSSLPQGAVRRGRVAPCVQGPGAVCPSGPGLEITREVPEKPSAPRWPLVSSTGSGSGTHGSSNTDCRFNRRAQNRVLGLGTGGTDLQGWEQEAQTSRAGNRRHRPPGAGNRRHTPPGLWSRNGRIQRGTLTEVTATRATRGEGPRDVTGPGRRQTRQPPGSVSKSAGGAYDAPGAGLVSGEGANRKPPNAKRASPSALQGLVSGKEPLGFFLLGNPFFVGK